MPGCPGCRWVGARRVCAGSELDFEGFDAFFEVADGLGDAVVGAVGAEGDICGPRRRAEPAFARGDVLHDAGLAADECAVADAFVVLDADLAAEHGTVADDGGAAEPDLAAEDCVGADLDVVPDLDEVVDLCAFADGGGGKLAPVDARARADLDVVADDDVAQVGDFDEPGS